MFVTEMSPNRIVEIVYDERVIVVNIKIMFAKSSLHYLKTLCM